MVAWIASLIAMKYYELDKERMTEIQREIEKRKQEVLMKEEINN